MFVVIPSLSRDAPHVIAVDRIVAMTYSVLSSCTTIYVSLNPPQHFTTRLSTVEVLALIKEAQMSSAVEYILRQDK